MIRGLTAAAVLLLCGCSGTSAPSAASTTSSSPPTSSEPGVTSPTVPVLASLACSDPIDGGPPPADWQTVLGVVALPASPPSRALQAFDSGDPTVPALFAKTGLLVRAGQAFELEVPTERDNPVAIGWGNALRFRPSARFAVPACPDTLGTGWLAYPGGYWVDVRQCLPLTVRAAGREQQVHIGIGTPCPGQEPPAAP